MPEPLARRLLVARYNDAGQPDDAAKIKTLDVAAVRRHLHLTMGTPPRVDRKDKAVVELLLTEWVGSLEGKPLQELAESVKASLGPAERQRTLASDRARRQFLRQRNHTQSFVANLRKAFVRVHKRSEPTRARSAQERDAESRIEVSGQGAADTRQLHPYQQRSIEQLDELLNGAPHAGVLVLPTGAGKTDVAATWALRAIAAGRIERVLWLAHQQELLHQAVERLAQRAAVLPRGFTLKVRELHSNAAPASVLAEGDLDIAAMTIQSLTRGWGPAKQKLLGRFLSRPTAVIVDEAHHAGAPTFAEVLTHIADQASVRAVVGLTATPWPSSTAAHSRFQQRFPRVVCERTVDQLIGEQVLARPLLTVMDTGLVVRLTTEEVRAAERGDLNDATLERLDHEVRHRVIVNTWTRTPTRWGKTLLFAPNIRQADSITDMLTARSVRARALHSEAPDRTEILTWFRRQRGPAVLVAVSMLNEGVDLPDAHSAFLARPTTSRILLQQMIGRVLRGPRSGGSAVAEVVHFHDEWQNLAEVLEPPDVFPAIAVTTLEGVEPRPLPPIVDDAGGAVPADVSAQIARMLHVVEQRFDLDDGDWVNDVPLDPLLVPIRLAGYYTLPDRTVPVFDHQQGAYDELIRDALAGSRMSARIAYFDDTPPPYPSPRTLRDLVAWVRELGEAPEFTSLDAVLSPQRCVERILAAGALTEEQRRAIIAEEYDTTLARVAYRSLDRFHAAVDQGLRAHSTPKRFEPEHAVRPPRRRKLPLLPRAERDNLDLLMRRVRDRCPQILPPQVLRRLGDDVPEPQWTRRVVNSTYGHWTLTLAGRNAGRQAIRINRLLRSSPKHVPDAMLEYLLFHELLHHLLPGQGHDAEFRELEASWSTDTPELDYWFDTLHERWETDPERYD